MTLIQTKQLGELCTKITDGSHFSPKSVSEGNLMASSKDMDENGWNFSDIKRISDSDYFKLVRADCKPKLNDVLIIKDGNSYLQKVFVVNKEIDIVILSSIAIIRPDSDKVIPEYLKYVLRTPYVKEAASNFVTGAAIPRVILSDFKKVQIPYYPIPTQRRIASILSAYDNLIEVNNQRVKLLEATAREIYKEWFVRMRFPAAGGKPGYKETKFVKGVPEGWEVKSVSEVFEVLGGGTPSTEVTDYWDGNINWFTPSDITSALGPFLAESQTKITQKGLRESSTRSFPAYSIMMTSRATIGAVGINTTTACTNQGFIICIPNEVVPFTFLYHWVSQNKELFEMLGTGSTFLEITKGTFKKIKLVLPNKEVIEKFHETCESMFLQIHNLQTQNDHLRQIRNRLLPRLISGKLQIKIAK